MAFDPLSQEVVYALKGNVAYPTVGASAAAVAGLAQTRLNDAFSPVTTTVPASAVTVVKQ